MNKSAGIGDHGVKCLRRALGALADVEDVIDGKTDAAGTAEMRALRIQVDQESLDPESDKRQPSRLAMTPQDVRFLKSLRIATDDIE